MEWHGRGHGTRINHFADHEHDGLFLTIEGQVDLVNCWDGTPLPPGNYKLVAYQDFYPESTQPAPTIEPLPSPSALPVDPAPLPVDPKPIPVDPTLAPVDPAPAPIEPTASPDRPITTDGSAVAGGAVAGNTGVVGPAADGSAERAVSNTVKLVIAGDAPKDPFGAYLSPAAPAVVYPDDYLTPATARDEYTSRATTGTWDMAAGSQRVVKTGDSLTQNDQNAWLNSYYGCSADGKSLPSFPAASADWSLLKVDATLPGSVGVSYGWVVDGNPVVKVSVKNVSSYTLPGFWGQPNTTMYLVKDGKVVATSYLAPTIRTAIRSPGRVTACWRQTQASAARTCGATSTAAGSEANRPPSSRARTRCSWSRTSP